MILKYVIAMLACLGGALSNECAELNGYSAVALDTINFVPSRAYFEAPFLLYFENNGNDGGQFFDIEEGVFYFKKADGTCDKYESDDFNLYSLGVAGLNEATKEILRFTDVDGETRVGKTLTKNNFLIKDLFSANCLNAFISYYYNDVLIWSYIFINPRALSDDDLEKVTNARAEFKALSCTSKSL